MAGFVKESYFFIWNAGSSSSDTASGPGCTLAAWTAGGSTGASFMDANGGPLLTSTTVTGTASGSDLLLNFATNALASIVDGTYCYVDFEGIYIDGYYELHKVDNTTAKLHPKTATVAVDSFVAYSDDVNVLHIYIGGAFKTQGDISSGTGFQNVDVGGSVTQNHYVYIRGNETLIDTVTFAKCGERDVNKWTKYIGVDASWIPLTQGNYVNLNFAISGTTKHIAQITSTTAENMRFENIGFINTSADSAAAATEMCFNKGNLSLGGMVFKNCYFKKGYSGYGWTATPVAGDIVLNCVAEDCRKYGIHDYSNGIIRGCYVFATGNCTLLTTSYGIHGSAGTTIAYSSVCNQVNTTNKEIAYGIYAETRVSIANCNLYGILTYDIYVVGYGNIIRNTILHVKTPGISKAIYPSTASYIEMNNITNDTAANCGFVAGSGSVSDLAITATDPWINAATGDFRLNRTGLALSNVIDCGFVPYCPSSIAGKTSIGAYSVGDMPLPASVVNDDSVMGTTGTFVEADRNTDPGEEHVESGVEYELYGATMTGSMIPMPPGSGGGGPNVIGSGIIMAVRGRTS
jgi:hypothetical protein